MAIYRQAFCPVCGMTHGTEVIERVPGKPYIKLTRRNFWERTKDYDPNKPFGVIQEAIGPGSFTKLGYFSPEEDKDGFFPLIKARLLTVLKEWQKNGWLTKEEIEDTILK